MGRDPELSIEPRVCVGLRVHDQIPNKPAKFLLAKILAFSAHKSWIKNTETKFGGKKKVVLILSQWRGEHSKLMPQELCPPHEGSRGLYKMRASGRPPYLPPANLYAGQKATVRTGHGTKDWFKIGKGVPQGCILSPCLFKLYAEYIMWNARLDESPAGIKVAERNSNNLRCADDTTLMAEN